MAAPGMNREQKERYVRWLFDGIAPRYDLMNRLMTGGLLRAWHRELARHTGLRPGMRALDVACGTGDLSFLAAGQVAPGGQVVGIDFSEEMLAVPGRRPASHSHGGLVSFLRGNALALPFPEASFDCATIGFALRNVADIGRCLAEMARCVRPGGRVIALEISRPPNPVWGALFRLYFYRLVPLMGRWAERRRPAPGEYRPYTYLPNSLTHFPDVDRLAAMLAQAGLDPVYYRRLTGGVATVHVGIRAVPQDAAPSPPKG